MRGQIYIPFDYYRDIGGPSTFMRNLKNYLDRSSYNYATEHPGTSGIFFPVLFSYGVLDEIKKKGGKIIQRLDGIYYPSKHGGKHSELNEVIKKIYLEYADFIIFQSEYSKMQCFEMLGVREKSEYEIIINGVDKEIFYPGGKDISGGKMRFITTGSFRNADMIVPVVKALDMLKGSFDFELTVAGPVTNKELLPYLERDYIRQTGGLNLNQVADVLREHHVFIYSHLNPPCPNSVLEAVSCGLPVVGFDSGSMCELLHFSKELLAPVSDDIFQEYSDFDPAKLADKLAFAADNYESYKTLAREKSGLYSFDECGSQYVNVFEMVTGSESKKKSSEKESIMPKEGSPNPLVSVLMSVYNGSDFLRESIGSILGQTYKNFEFIIIDDGSTDKSAEIIESYDDNRIIFLKNNVNIGLTASLNKGLRLAQGVYLARMDHDDISLPGRLMKQVDFMEQNTEIGICGTWIETFGDMEGFVPHFPASHDDIKCMLFYENPIPHPTVMIRLEAFGKHGLSYNEKFLRSQDYELWIRASEFLRLANIPEPLVKLRLHKDQIRAAKGSEQTDFAAKARKIFTREFSGVLSEEEINLNEQIARKSYDKNIKFIDKAHQLMLKLIAVNSELKIFPQAPYSSMLAERWLLICLNAHVSGFRVYLKYLFSPLKKYIPENSGILKEFKKSFP